MQHTEKYQLNLIEKDDVFSPEALNQNMEKVEAKLAALDGADTAEAQARAQADAALDQRLQVFEARRMVFGIIPHSDKPTEINLGFDPKAVLIIGIEGRAYCGMLLTEHPEGMGAKLIPNGFRMPGATSMDLSNASFTSVYATFGFLALG